MLTLPPSLNYQTRLGTAYASTYLKSPLIRAAERVSEAAEAAGLSGHAVALRWTVYHSALSARYGDAVILGASSAGQLERNLEAVEAGPLDEDLAHLINSVWLEDEEVRKEAGKYHL